MVLQISWSSVRPVAEPSCSGRPDCGPASTSYAPLKPVSAAHRSRTQRGNAAQQLRCQATGSNGANGARPATAAPALDVSSDGAGPAPAQAAAGSSPLVWTKFVAETLLPTKQGKFRLRGYRHTTDGGKTFTEPTAIIAGPVEGCSDVPVRVHDACFTSEVLGSLKCDCREQLQLALDYIHNNPPGMVIYLQQEGRGIGLANKIAAYALQEKGLDTVDANRALGLPDDCREYSAVDFILQDLGIASIKLMTNNPRKMTEMSQRGIAITGRIPCLVKAQAYNASYLSAKEQRMSHLLSYDEGDFGSHEQQRVLLSSKVSSTAKATQGRRPVAAAPGRSATGADGGSGSSSEDEEQASLEEVSAGIVGDGTAVVREGVVGVVVSGSKHSHHTSQQQQQQGSSMAYESQLDGSFCYWDHDGEPSSAGIPMEPQVSLPEGLDQISGPPLGSTAASSVAAGTSTSSSSAGAAATSSQDEHGCGGSKAA